MPCSQFKTSSWYVDHPCFLFHTVLSLPLFYLKVPIYVHNRSLELHMGSSTRVRARMAKWVRLDKPGWTPGKHPFLPSCPTSRDLPGPTRTPLLHQPLFTDPSRAVLHHKLQLKNERLFLLVFTCCHTDLDWQILRGMGRKVSLQAHTGYCREQKRVIAEGCTAPVKLQPQYHFYEQRMDMCFRMSHWNQNPTTGAAWIQWAGLGL